MHCFSSSSVAALAFARFDGSSTPKAATSPWGEPSLEQDDGVGGIMMAWTTTTKMKSSARKRAGMRQAIITTARLQYEWSA